MNALAAVPAGRQYHEFLDLTQRQAVRFGAPHEFDPCDRADVATSGSRPHRSFGLRQQPLTRS